MYNFVLALNATVLRVGRRLMPRQIDPDVAGRGPSSHGIQHGLDSVATDVAAVKACLARVSSPAVLVGHSSNDAHKITQPLSQTPQEDDMKRYLAALGAAVLCINLAMAASAALTPLR